MEGETRRSTFPRAASPLAQLVDMHGGALCGRGEGQGFWGVTQLAASCPLLADGMQ